MQAADLKRIPRQRFMPAQINAVGELEVEAVISTAAVARDGHIFVPQGAKLDNYRKNPVVLWQHDTMQPAVGRCRPRHRRRKVVLPAPLGPSKPNTQPGSIFKVTSLRAIWRFW